MEESSASLPLQLYLVHLLHFFVVADSRLRDVFIGSGGSTNRGGRCDFAWVAGFHIEIPYRALGENAYRLPVRRRRRQVVNYNFFRIRQ